MARAVARFLLLHETPGKNHPAIFFRLFFPESACPHRARSIRSLRNNPRDVARKTRQLAFHTRVEPTSPCLPNRATFFPAGHSASQTSPPDTRAALPASMHRFLPPESLRNTASALHKSTADRSSSPLGSSVSRVPRAAGTFHSTNEKTRAATDPSAFPSNRDRAGFVLAAGCRLIRGAQGRLVAYDPSAQAGNRISGNDARRRVLPSLPPVAARP